MTTLTSTGRKYCASCRTTKDRTEFYNNVSRRDGLHSYCKACTSAQRADRRRRNPGEPPAPAIPPSRYPVITELTDALRLDWADQAQPACAGKLAVLQCHGRLPDGRHNENAARVMCAGCPLLVDCAEWVLNLPQGDDPDDLWICGGLNRDQRRAARRRRARAVAA